MSDATAPGQLRAFVERIERVEVDIAEQNAEKSEIYKELRFLGFDVKTVRKIVAKRKLDTSDREEQDALFDMYWDAIHGAPRVHVHEASNSYSLPSPSTEAKQAGEGEPLQPSPVTPVPSVLRSPVVVGGRPYPSSDEAPAGQHGMFGQSEQQSGVLTPVRNEPELVGTPSATKSAMTAKTQAELIRLLRPNCRHADDLEKCGGQGSKHCHACQTAAREVAI